MAVNARIQNPLNPILPVFGIKKSEFTYEALDAVFERATRKVKVDLGRDVTFIFFGHLCPSKAKKGIDAENFLLFQFQESKSLIPIDILTVISNGALKSLDSLSEELALKVDRFYKYFNKPGLHRSPMGAWIDVRYLKKHRVDFDSDKILTVDGVRVLSLDMRPIDILFLHSTTALRFIDTGNKIWIGDPEVVRKTNKGYFIDLNEKLGSVIAQNFQAFYKVQQIELTPESAKEILETIKLLD